MRVLLRVLLVAGSEGQLSGSCKCLDGCGGSAGKEVTVFLQHRVACSCGNEVPLQKKAEWAMNASSRARERSHA
jgi:hypothetical protein